MTILALEFSSARRSVALARGGEVLAEAFEQTAERGTKVFGLIEQVLGAAKISRVEIDAVAVGLGPGSYTGIRAAIAVAQGWQLARGAKLLGVSSIEALAAQAQQERFFGLVNLAVDAQRKEFYLSTWRISETERVEISPLRIVAAEEIEKLGRDGEIYAGPEMARGLFPAAAAIARLARGRTDFAAGETLEPIYLRQTSFVKAPLRATKGV
jgi:tRNA threonylcarbamoyladenosine biosynthesis protein TsaB